MNIERYWIYNFFFPGCAAPLGMESRKIRDNQIKVSTYGTGINMRARNARLDRQ